MTIFLIVFEFLGGIALFLHGMRYLSDGLRQVASGRLRHILRFLTRNRVMAVLAGAGATCLIRSTTTRRS